MVMTTEVLAPDSFLVVHSCSSPAHEGPFPSASHHFRPLAASVTMAFLNFMCTLILYNEERGQCLILSIS